MANQDAIDEVSQEHEDGESHEHIQKMSNLYPNPQYMNQQDDMMNMDNDQEDGPTEMDDGNMMQQQQDQDIGQD